MTDRIDPRTAAARQLAELARQTRERQGPHPSIETLSAYKDGKLDEAETEELQDHLAACRDCTRTLLDLRRFEELMDAGELPPAAPTPAQTAASWQAVRARLAAELEHPAPAHPISPQEVRSEPAAGKVLDGQSRFRRFATAPLTVGALAAGLLACLIGFPAWIVAQHAAESRAPLALSVLGGAEVNRGADRDLLTVDLRKKPAVLVLPLPDRPPFASYRIEIRTPEGELRAATPSALIPVATPLQGAPAAAPPPQLLAMALRPGLLAPGEYRVRLIGVQNGHGETLAEHLLRVKE